MPPCASRRSNAGSTARPLARAATVLAGLLPDARVERVAGAGHLISWEQPKQLVQRVTAFLAEPAARAGGFAATARQASEWSSTVSERGR